MNDGNEARKIIHVDMDAFYASVEQRDHPETAGLPLAVGGSGPRAVVVAASYEARVFGVRSALPMSRALRLCPDLIVLPPRFDVYRSVSREINAIFLSYTDLVEPLALDEAALDVSEPKRGPRSATLIARAIKRDIRQQTALTASAGVAGSRFLAKVASGLQKPDGLTVIAPAEAQTFLDNLAVEKFVGVGPITAKRLHEAGLRTGADIRSSSKEKMTALLGKNGTRLFDIACGHDNRPVDPNRPRKSIGSETTFDHDLSEQQELDSWLEALCRDVSQSLIQRDLSASTVTVKFRFSDFRTVTRSRSPGHYLRSADELLRVARQLAFDSERPDLPIRLLGVSVSGFRSAQVGEAQPRLAFGNL